MLILKASAVNLEDSDLIKRLFTLFNGMHNLEDSNSINFISVFNCHFVLMYYHFCCVA